MDFVKLFYSMGENQSLKDWENILKCESSLVEMTLFNNLSKAEAIRSKLEEMNT